ncbi:tubulin polyglutamylase TTLL13-like [Hypanus sabinus]|uniref:tubulin polyglutamylase TTLL13-like n=1 Tax=Hypanus sabinus TaxID=79690 RepID=UPI0028C5015C|nr:tubulin polyglutamylase TTLL13-like [Hypanus sabinus]
MSLKFRRAAALLGLKEVGDDEEWTLLWTDCSVTVEKAIELKSYQKINRFPGMNEICRKDLLARNLNQMLRQYPEDYNIFPKTWCLPSEYPDFVDYCRGKKPKIFICKPNSKCQGRGIFLTRKIRDVKPREDMICQVYIPKPFILDGYKFDLRLYVLITSCDPLRVYLYNEGLIRFATTKYTEPTEKNLDDICMHLTNYAINKNKENFVQDENRGSKRKLSSFNRYMESNAYDLERLWSSIEDVVIKTILSAYPALKHNYITCFPKHVSGSACFQILGFDVLLDHALKPWLLEVNQSPSLTTDSKLDQEVKDSLLYDTLCMINLAACDRRKVMEEERQRTNERLLNISRSQEYRLMRMEIQQRQEQNEMFLKGRRFPEKDQRGESPLQKNPTRLVLVMPKSPEEPQTSPSSIPTSQVLEVVPSPSQAAGCGEENVGPSSELSPGRADAEQERASEQNADSSEHGSPLRNRAPAEQGEPDQRQRQAEVPSKIAAEVQGGTAGSGVENQPEATVQELEAHSGAQAVEEESPSHQTSSETSSQILSGSLDKVNQDLQFQPETCLQPQARAEAQDQNLREAQDQSLPEAQDQSLREAQDQSQPEAQDQSLREAQDQGRLPAQGLLQKEFQDQPLQELHHQPEMEEGACDKVHKEVCECGQAEAQHQDRDEDSQSEILDLDQESMVVEETELADTLPAEGMEPSGPLGEFHPEAQSRPGSQDGPEAPALPQQEQMATREMPGTADNPQATSWVINKLSKALKSNRNQVGPEEDVSYPRRTDAAKCVNVAEEISDLPRDQRDSCCSCWGYNRVRCVSWLRDGAAEPGCRNRPEHQQGQAT